MSFSSIKRKKCKCNEFCDKYPTLGWNGYFMGHAPQELRDKQTKKQVEKKNRANLTKLSRLVHEAANDTNSEISANHEPANRQKVPLVVWFNERRKEMTGKCACGCGKNSSKYEEKYFKFSIAHVLGKAKFKSVATHPDNWIELAFWGGCHTTFDDMGYERCMKTNPLLWEKVVKKFKKVYPFIASEEYQYIPDVLLQEINQI